MEVIFLPGIGASDRDFPEYRVLFDSISIIRYEGCNTLEEHLQRIDETIQNLETGQTDYIIVGHSMGAHLAHYYVTHRELNYLKGYTMVGGAPRFSPLNTWKTIFSLSNFGIKVVLFFIALGAPFLFLIYGWYGMYQRINVIDLFLREGVDEIKATYTQTLQPLKRDPKRIDKDIPVQLIRLPRDLLLPDDIVSETQSLIPQIDDTVIDRDLIHFTHHLDVLVVGHIHQWVKRHDIGNPVDLPFDMEYALSNPKSISVELEGFYVPRPPVIFILLVLIGWGIVQTFPNIWITAQILSFTEFLTTSLGISGLSCYWLAMFSLLLIFALFGYSWIISPKFPYEQQFRIGDYPKISIILPMRNEERNIKTCLKSLLSLNYPNYEVFISDGNSEDMSIRKANEAVVEYNDMGIDVQIIEEDPLPAGWVGKSWGCWSAAQKATGDYFLFTDADTTHERDSLRLVVRAIQDRNLTGLSTIGKFITVSFWERAILPFFKTLLFILFGGRFVNSGRTLAIGQYIMVERSTYFLFGGHQQIKSEIAEDIHLAEYISENGKFEAYNGNNIYSVRMYQSATEIKEGLTRNASESVGNGIYFVFIAIIGLLTWRFSPVLGYILFFNPSHPIVNSVLLYYTLFIIGIYWIDTRVNDDPWWYLLLMPLGVIALSYFLFIASISSSKGEARIWKGRSYKF